MPATQFEPMSVGGILDQTFRLYKQHFARFLAIVAIVQVPIGLIGLLLVAQAGMLDPEMVEAGGAAAEPEFPVSPGLAAIAAIFAVFLTVLGLTLCHAALIKSISESYLGNEVSVGEAYGFILPKLLTIIWAGIVVGFVVMLGFFLLIVPGIIFTVWYALTIQIVVIEGRGATDAMRRSKELTSGNRGKVLAVILLAALLEVIVSLAGDFILGFVAGMVLPDTESVLLIAQSVINIITGVLAAPISATAVILLYYDMRIRKEGFDLQMLAQTLGAEQSEHADVFPE